MSKLPLSPTARSMQWIILVICWSYAILTVPVTECVQSNCPYEIITRNTFGMYSLLPPLTHPCHLEVVLNALETIIPFFMSEPGFPNSSAFLSQRDISGRCRS